MRNLHECEDLAVLISDTRSSNKTLEHSTDCFTLFCNMKALHIYRWMSPVVKALLRCNKKKNPEFRRFPEYGHIDVKTLTKYIDLLTTNVAVILPDKLGITFGAEFPGESALEKFLCRVECLKFLYFLLPYSLFSTLHRNFLQFRLCREY